MGGIQMNGATNTALGEQISKIKDTREKVDALTTAYSIMAQEMRKQAEAIAALETAIRSLNARVDMASARSRAEPQEMTVKAMASRLNITGNQEKMAVLRFLARQYCTTNNLQIRKADGAKAHEYFPTEAAQHAMDKLIGGDL